MALGSSGQDEVIRVGVQTSVTGVKESLDQLKHLSTQLTAIDKQIRSGLNVDALGRQFANVVKEFDKVTKAVTSGSSDSKRAVDSLTNQVKNLNAEMSKTQKSKGIGFVGSKTDSDALKRYQASMEAIGTPVMGGAKSFGMLVRNMRSLNSSLGDTSKAGIATRDSIKAVHDAGAVAFMPALTRGEQLKIQLGSLRKNISGFTQELQSLAKDRQWIGRQMIEGITVPIAGMGTMAIRSFMSVQSEMVQLKKVTEFGAQKESADAFYDSLVNGAQGIREMSREFGIGRKAATALFKDVAALGVDGEEDIKKFANAVSEIAMVGEVDTQTAMQFFRTMNAIFAGGATNADGLAKTRDLMAQMSAVADETSLQLQDLAAAFPEVAPVMQQMGFSAGGVASALAGMYKRGIPATEAAHGLKFALQRLVSPTKDAKAIIDEMGFSFFDASGNAADADVRIFAMAKNLAGLSNEAKNVQLGEMFGLRQTARMSSFFSDVEIGRQELERFSAGTLKASEITSDFARGLIASGEIAGASLKPMDRYNKALEEIKKDPTVGLKRLKAAFDDFKVQLGATLAPALLTVGEQLTKVLDAFTNLPKGVQIALVGFAGFVAILGPMAYMGAQATHAIASMGRMAAMTLPKMVDITEAMARTMAAAGRRDVAQVGSRFVGLQGRADRMRLRLGIPTASERAVQAARGTAGGAALAPETAATATLTSAKEALTVASAKVAAAEAVEAAAHNGNTAAMTAQAVATNKGAIFDAKVLRWRNLNTGAIISQSEALKVMTASQLAMYNVANKTYSAQNIKNAKSFFSAMSPKAATAAAAAPGAANQAFVEAIRAREAMRLTQLPPPPPMKMSEKLGFGQKTGSIKSEFKSLFTSANQSFFVPVGNAADRAKQKLLSMARAAKLSSVGQAVSSAGASTIGAFSKGKSGELSGVAGVAAMAGMSKVGKIFASLGKVFGGLSGKLSLIGGPLGKVISLFLRFNKITFIITAVAGAIAFVAMMFKGMKTNWDAVYAKIEPGVTAIKDAFNRLKEVFAEVFNKMMGIFGQLGSGAEDGKSSASTFEGIGQIVGDALSGIAKMIDWLGSVIQWLWPLFERTAYIIKDVVGFISSLFQGDWKQAFMFAVAAVYEFYRPVLVIFDVILKAAAQFIANFLDQISLFTGWVPWLGDQIKNARNALEGFSDRGIIPAIDEKLRTGLGGVFGPGTTGPAKNKAKDAGSDVGQTLGDAINSGAADAADGGGWVKDWIAKVVEQIDKQIEKVRESAMAALEKAQEAALKVYDDRIKAIEDQEKAEEKLYKTEEYLANKREMLAKRNLDSQNYQKERALAIYEGRFNDARLLDMQERVNKQSFDKEIGNLETSRSKDLIKDARDAAKEQINVEKDAAKERFDVQKKAFEDYLDLIFEMTPVTVEQFQSMMDQINSVLEKNGAKWPEYADTAMSRMAEALRKANKSVINEFNRSENNPLLQWVAAFAEPEVVAILKAGLSKATGGGGGFGGMPDSGEPTPTPSSGITMDKKDAYGILTGKSEPEGWRDMDPEKKSEFIRKAEEVAGVPESERGKTMPGSEHFKMMEAEYAKIEAAEKKAESIRRRSIALYGEELGVKSNMLAMAEKIATSWSSATTVMRQNSFDFTKASVNDFKNVGAMGSREAKNIKEVWDATTNTLSYATDEFGNKWTMTQNGMVNQFGESARVIKDESGKITSIQVDNANKVMQASKVSYQLANAVFQEMIAKGIKPGTEEAAKYEQRIKGLGYQASLVNGQQVLIPVDADDTSARAVLGRLYRLISETNYGIARDPDNERNIGLVAKANAKGFVYAMAASSLGYASGGLVKAQKDGIIANIGEGGFDEYVITTDPKYRASNLGYLSAAASRLGVKMASGAAIKAASGGMFTSTGAGGSSAEYAAGMGGDVYINVDTFIGEEQWFAEMANKYNMKTVPRQRKIEGQQKRVVSSYNDRYRLR